MLLGLVSFLTEKWKKEVDIRKVLGASVGLVVELFLKEFTRLAIMSGLLAWPIAYWATNEWLQHFAYRIDFNVWAFFFSSLAQIVSVVFTIGLQTSRAVHVNPVDALRCE